MNNAGKRRRESFTYHFLHSVKGPEEDARTRKKKMRRRQTFENQRTMKVYTIKLQAAPGTMARERSKLTEAESRNLKGQNKKRKIIWSFLKQPLQDLKAKA